MKEAGMQEGRKRKGIKVCEKLKTYRYIFKRSVTDCIQSNVVCFNTQASVSLYV